MSLSQDLFGTTRTIPQSTEVSWGAQVTAQLSDLIYAADTLMMLVGTQGVLALKPATVTPAASGTLTPSSPWLRVSGSGGAVTLDATTAISDGSKDGQILLITGLSNTNTVTIPDAANTELNGLAILALGESIRLVWDSARSLWVELTRSN